MPKEHGSRKTKAKEMVRRALHKSLNDLSPESTKNSFTKRVMVGGSGDGPSSMSCFGVSDGESRTHLIQAVDDMNYRDMQRLDRRIRVLHSTSESNPSPSSNMTRSPGIHSSSTTARQKPSRQTSSRALHGSRGAQAVSSASSSYAPHPYGNYQGISPDIPSAEGAAPYAHRLAIHEAQVTHHGESVRGFAFGAYQAQPFYPGADSSATMMGENIKIGSNLGYPQQPPAFGLPNYPISHAVPFTGSSYVAEVTSHGTELTSHPHISESDLMLVNQPEDNITSVHRSIYFSVPQNFDGQPRVLHRRPSYLPPPALSPVVYRSPNYSSNIQDLMEFQYNGFQQCHNEVHHFY